MEPMTRIKRVIAVAGPIAFLSLEGIKLEERRQSMPIIVIDKVDRVPAENQGATGWAAVPGESRSYLR